MIDPVGYIQNFGAWTDLKTVLLKELIQPLLVSEDGAVINKSLKAFFWPGRLEGKKCRGGRNRNSIFNPSKMKNWTQRLGTSQIHTGANTTLKSRGASTFQWGFLGEPGEFRILGFATKGSVNPWFWDWCLGRAERPLPLCRSSTLSSRRLMHFLV